MTIRIPGQPHTSAVMHDPISDAIGLSALINGVIGAGAVIGGVGGSVTRGIFIGGRPDRDQRR